MMGEQELGAAIRKRDAAVRYLLKVLSGGEQERTTCYLLHCAALKLGDGPLADALNSRRDKLSEAVAAWYTLGKPDVLAKPDVPFDRQCNRCEKRDVSVEQICAACLAERMTLTSEPNELLAIVGLRIQRVIERGGKLGRLRIRFDIEEPARTVEMEFERSGDQMVAVPRTPDDIDTVDTPRRA